MQIKLLCDQVLKQFTKSNPYIVMVSTPNAPDDLFEQIEKETEAKIGNVFHTKDIEAVIAKGREQQRKL